MKTTLERYYRLPVPKVWIDEDQFIGTIEYAHPRLTPSTSACYGWTKGAGFFIYSIGSGHITKLGSVPRELIKN